MNQSNFDNFSFDNYQHPPAKKTIFEKIFGPSLGAKFRNPIFATGALLLAGAAFAGIIIASYPSGDDGGEVPVIQAERTAYKTQPGERGGMNVPYQDSTVFSGLRDGEGAEGAPVENLFASEEPVDRLEAFAAEAERIIEESEAREKTLSLIEDATGVEGAGEAEVAVAEPKVMKQEVEKIRPEELMQKVEKTPATTSTTTAQAGTSPDTIEFVQSVLDKKDGKVPEDEVALNTIPEEAMQAAAARAAAFEPAAGVAAGAGVRPGSHYIQLGSVKTATGAADEWSKLQKKYPSELAGLEYRVQRADLGERGVFYRIQAGPISGEDAGSLCDSIKAQSPGACLVTK